MSRPPGSRTWRAAGTPGSRYPSGTVLTGGDRTDPEGYLIPSRVFEGVGGDAFLSTENRSSLRLVGMLMRAGELRSGDALFSFDDELLVHSWNRAAEELIGVRAEEAVGRPCWEVLGATDPDGTMVCHRGCPLARLVREGSEVPAHELLVRSASGPRRITLSTIALTAEPRLFLHLMRPARQPAGSSSTQRNAALTPRQVEVLGLLAEGLTAKAVATQLGIAVATVRNHIREILHALGAHSQLEALAKARREGILRR